ncbi:hypothetical protein M406DRAFT_338658 [Cryphonectria parasitica EP155]|uniref:rRNA-processing protein FYV7 n=1 Tax=Cryphonectria parasitica (strain ATCC 38755 / EP155) TaxID=660469 RepID=A0A9P4Y772_CRYP1|nr:uncharacterized protein M406DRAFT_338658 [Cryphonectria parasitica EP155]KAF3767998.1 hypothetical protein M406DRAFT_338658 [Cryphonectria parasitica EP155]
MAPKRPHQDIDPSTDASNPEPKKRKGFRVGPENLPDGAWRRKNTKIKEDLIHKAKIKKAYKKVKAEVEQQQQQQEKTVSQQQQQQQQTNDNNNDNTQQEAESQIHPERQALLDDDQDHPANPRPGHDESGTAPPPPPRREKQPRNNNNNNSNNNRRRPDYYEKALQEGSRKKAEAEARAAEQRRREEERAHKVADRDRMRRAMLKARGIKPSRGGGGRQQHQHQQGQHKLGRESHVLLEKVKRMVGGAA